MSRSKFVYLAAQLALVTAVARVYHVEEVYGFRVILPVIFGGFLVHAWLPMRWRLPFFVLLSFAALGVLLGFLQSVGLIVLGLGLLALCHAPVPYAARVGLVVAAGAGAAVVRAGGIDVPGWEALPAVILPMLAGLFMFRLMIYLHDLRHERAPASWWARIAYFFLLPNVCFPLFPVVDYRTFLRTYYDREDASGIYQKGMVRVFRGVTHLLLYRVVYLYVVPDPVAVNGPGTLALYVAGTFLLFLRVSGLFHLSTGLLGLFGFDLPPVFRRYLLASSFTDLWRRLNVYWRDFMRKLFFFPALVRLRRFGARASVAASVVLVFAASWALHAYQWFWLRGEVPVRLTDALFWGGFAALTAGSAVYELGRGRALRPEGFAFRAALGRAVRVLGVFAVAAALWTLEASGSVGAFAGIVARGAAGDAGEYAGLALVAAALVGLGVAAQGLGGRGVSLFFEGRRAVAPRAGLVVSVGAAALLALGLPALWTPLGPAALDTLAALQRDRFNQRLATLGEPGYFEGLLAPGAYTVGLWQVHGRPPADWKRTIVEAGAGRYTGDLLRYELLPSVEVRFKRVSLRTNRWGMRDRDYARRKPPGTFRMALVGASTEMGWGVENDQTFEAVAERMLNAGDFPGKHERYEILNFAVTGYSLLQVVRVVDTKVFDFEPDVLLMPSMSNPDLIVSMLSRRIERGDDLNYPFLRDLVGRAGVTPGMPLPEMERRLRPFVDEILRWGYARIAAACRAHGVTPVWLFAPHIPDERGKRHGDHIERAEAVARETGFVTISLDGAFDGVNEPWRLRLAPWDLHANAEAHALMGRRLYRALRENAGVLGL
ncbi:SGNH/GDSL hydrolase family protein [Rhodocaloribacter sp.]